VLASKNTFEQTEENALKNIVIMDYYHPSALILLYSALEKTKYLRGDED